MNPPGRPLQLILARNLMASLQTPAFLVDARGAVVFYNEAAGGLLGRRFEESGPMPFDAWTATFGPFGEDGEPLEYSEIGVTAALRGNRAAHTTMRIRSASDVEHEIAVSALPIKGDDGFHGGMVFFWPVGDDEEA